MVASKFYYYFILCIVLSWLFLCNGEMFWMRRYTHSLAVLCPCRWWRARRWSGSAVVPPWAPGIYHRPKAERLWPVQGTRAVGRSARCRPPPPGSHCPLLPPPPSTPDLGSMRACEGSQCEGSQCEGSQCEGCVLEWSTRSGGAGRWVLCEGRREGTDLPTAPAWKPLDLWCSHTSEERQSTTKIKQLQC